MAIALAAGGLGYLAASVVPRDQTTARPAVGAAPIARSRAAIPAHSSGANPTGGPPPLAGEPGGHAANLRTWVEALGLTVGELVQVLVTGLSAIGAVAAALAAWNASRIAQDSLREMHEARLQPVRPALGVSVVGRMEVRWYKNVGVGLRVSEDIDAQWQEGTAQICATNYGLGTARDIEFSLDACNFRLPRGTGRNLERFFGDGRAGRHFRHDASGIQVTSDWHGRSKHYSFKEHRVYTGDKHAVCGVGETVSWLIPDEALIFICLAAFAHNVLNPLEREEYCVALPAYIRCRSFAGEPIGYRYSLTIGVGQAIFRPDEYIVAGYPHGREWNLIDATISLRIADLTNERSFPASVPQALFWAIWGNEAAIEHLTSKPKRVRMHEAWLRRRSRRRTLKRLWSNLTRSSSVAL